MTVDLKKLNIMNKTFDIKRFGNMLRYDGMSYFQKFGLTLGIFLGTPVGIWFLAYTNMSVSDLTMGDNRYAFLKFLMIIVMILAPSRLYKTCNDSRRGIQFAMLPASSLEKFLSMMIFCCVVTPILYMTGAVAIDSILTLIPGNNPYDGFVFKHIFNHDLVNINLGSEMAEYSKTIKLPLAKVFSLLAYVSIFMFTNMLFKKRKVSKTIGTLAILGIILMVIIIRFTINYEELNGSFTEEEFLESNKALIRWVYYGSYALNVIMSSVMLYFTYYKIRKQKY